MPGQPVAEGIQRFHSRFVNWYLVADGRRLTAIDAGLPPDWMTLRRALAHAGRAPRDLEAVVLTHAHVDHVGFAERARAEWGVQVYLHEDDGPLIDHWLRPARSERTPLAYLIHPSFRRAFAVMLLTGAFRGKHIRAYETFRDGDVLPVPGRPRAIHTPGHTFGHCALHLPERGVLFSGDEVVTFNPYVGRAGPQIISRGATADFALALQSLDRLEGIEAAVVLPGHGGPWTGGVAEAVRLAREAGVS